MNESSNNISIKSIDDLLEDNLDNLDIPHYQRPYKWTIHNISDLLNDISNAIEEAQKYPGLKYRLGTIIVHKNNGKCDLVDGQQRVISLILIKKCVDPDFDCSNCSILNKPINNKISQRNIRNNYMYINEWFTYKPDYKESFNDAFSNILEAVVINVERTQEAFQLFDSQNTRGKELDPHDLLKAYHLREMRNDRYEMEHAVIKWEAKDTQQICELFDLYLFPIWNWSRCIKSHPFTARDIDIYKGIGTEYTYTYARRAGKAMPYFQIAEPFIAGNDFFEMVDHYILLLQDVKSEIMTNTSFKNIKEVLEWKSDSVGFGYSKNLFYCVLLCYYDRFHNFDEMAVKKLFTWAFMIRVDMSNLGFATINKYAIGDGSNSNYSNNIAMFSMITNVRLHKEISDLQLYVPSGDTQNVKWNYLLKKLQNISGKGKR